MSSLSPKNPRVSAGFRLRSLATSASVRTSPAIAALILASTPSSWAAAARLHAAITHTNSIRITSPPAG